MFSIPIIDEEEDDILPIAAGASAGGIVIIIAVPGFGVLIWILCRKRGENVNVTGYTHTYIYTSQVHWEQCK